MKEKSKGKNQKAKGKRAALFLLKKKENNLPTFCFLIFAFCLLISPFGFRGESIFKTMPSQLPVARHTLSAIVASAASLGTAALPHAGQE